MAQILTGYFPSEARFPRTENPADRALPRLKILIVDDSPFNSALLSAFAHEQGHVPIVAGNGAQAIERFLADAPDMIFMDLMMPVMDGMQAAASIKALSVNRFVPILFITVKDQSEDMARALELGGDAYVTKPIDFAVLQAKVKALQRVVFMQRQLQAQREALQRYHDKWEEDRRVARHVMKKLVRFDAIQDELLDYWVAPPRGFSGDVIAASRARDGRLYAMLADVTGHDLAAALTAMPLIQIFYAMTAKGYNLSNIAQQINKEIYANLAVDRFVAATLVAVDTAQCFLEIWNGGNPAAIFISDNGGIEQRFESRHLPLGILSDNEFDAKTEVFDWKEPGQLIFFSDGVVETVNERHEAFGIERAVRLLHASEKHRRLSALQEAVEAHSDGHPNQDDLSIITIRCLCESRLPVVATGSSVHNLARSVPGSWKFEVELGPQQLRGDDAVPMLMQWVESMGIDAALEKKCFLVLSELFSNALDFGLLKLDAHPHHLGEGLDQYTRERLKRLSELKTGTIRISVEHPGQPGQPRLILTIKDSGDGFDAQRYLTGDPGEQGAGRGIALVRSLATRLVYSEDGVEVRAEF